MVQGCLLVETCRKDVRAFGPSCSLNRAGHQGSEYSRASIATRGCDGCSGSRWSSAGFRPWGRAARPSRMRHPSSGACNGSGRARYLDALVHSTHRLEKSAKPTRSSRSTLLITRRDGGQISNRPQLWGKRQAPRSCAQHFERKAAYDDISKCSTVGSWISNARRKQRPYFDQQGTFSATDAKNHRIQVKLTESPAQLHCSRRRLASTDQTSTDQAYGIASHRSRQGARLDPRFLDSRRQYRVKSALHNSSLTQVWASHRLESEASPTSAASREFFPVRHD